MSEEEQRQLFLAAREAQLVRNDAAKIIMSDTSQHHVLHGAFVRVLVELPDHSDNYIIARVGAVTTGEPYDGFGYNTITRTDKYLILVLPQSLASINGSLYQINSISNSPMTEDEFSTWLSMMQAPENALHCAYRGVFGDVGELFHVGNNKIPSREELLNIGVRIQALGFVGGHSNRNNNGRWRQSNSVLLPGRVEQPADQPECATVEERGVVPSVPSVNGGPQNVVIGSQDHSGLASNGPSSLAHENHINPTPSDSGHAPATTEREGANGGAPLFNTPTTPPSVLSREQELDLPSRHQIRQDVLNKLNQQSVVFPLNIDQLKLSQLRLTERDMIEYLEHVRDALSSKQENCVVCLDHVPTVISLPCRHKVLCRLCASAVSMCPVCRSQLFELFEPKEI